MKKRQYICDYITLEISSDFYNCCTIVNRKNFLHMYEQVAQLLQRKRATGWVRFEWVVGDGMGKTKCYRCQKIKAFIFYTINPLLYEKEPLCVFEPLFGGFGVIYALHVRLIGKPLLDFLLVIIAPFLLGLTTDEQ